MKTNNDQLPKIDSASALLLDVDGTLLDIASSPSAVTLPDGLTGDLTHLSDTMGGAVAFLSGRSLDSLDRIFAPLMLPAVGCHGAELRFADGHVVQDDPLPDDVRECFMAIATSDNRLLAEDKRYSVALHYRHAPELAASLREEAQNCLARCAYHDLTVLQGHMVLEIKRASVTKGTGLRALMAQPPFKGRKPVFAGDDRTDEDALAALPEYGGIGISVGRKSVGASYDVCGPRDIREWIARLVRAGA